MVQAIDDVLVAELWSQVANLRSRKAGAAIGRIAAMDAGVSRASAAVRTTKLTAHWRKPGGWHQPGVRNIERAGRGLKDMGAESKWP